MGHASLCSQSISLDGIMRESFQQRESDVVTFTGKKPRGSLGVALENPNRARRTPLTQRSTPTRLSNPWRKKIRPLRGRPPTAPFVGGAPSPPSWATPHRLRRGRIDEMDTSREPSTRPEDGLPCKHFADEHPRQGPCESLQNRPLMQSSDETLGLWQWLPVWRAEDGQEESISLGSSRSACWGLFTIAQEKIARRMSGSLGLVNPWVNRHCLEGPTCPVFLTQ